MSSPLRLALFDCDGTLVDSHRTIQAAMMTAWEAEGLGPLDVDRLIALVGLSLEEVLQQLLPDADSVQLDRLLKAYRAAFVANRSDPTLWEPLFPRALEALDALEGAGMVLGIATGKTRGALQTVLELHGLADRFLTIQTPDVAPGKPNPTMVLQAASAVGVSPADTVVIGDTVFDIQMARAAKSRSVGVAWGYHDADMLAAQGADRVVDDFADLPHAVADLFEGSDR